MPAEQQRQLKRGCLCCPPPRMPSPALPPSLPLLPILARSSCLSPLLSPAAPLLTAHPALPAPVLARPLHAIFPTAPQPSPLFFSPLLPSGLPQSPRRKSGLWCWTGSWSSWKTVRTTVRSEPFSCELAPRGYVLQAPGLDSRSGFCAPHHAGGRGERQCAVGWGRGSRQPPTSTGPRSEVAMASVHCQVLSA